MGPILAAAALIPALASAAYAGGGTCALKMMAVNGGTSYSQEIEIEPGEQGSYDGPAKKRGRGPQRDIIFHALLNTAGENGFRLDYQAEVAAPKGPPRPPFQVQGKALLRPGRQLLAASAGGWKYYLKLENEGACSGKYAGTGAGTMDARLKCGRRSYPVSFSYLTNEQYSASLYEEDGGEITKFMIGLLPGGAAFDGTFQLQYVVQLKEGSETVTDNSGRILLAPGGGRQKASAGKGCAFTVKAGR